jgi:hypothetical protein
MISKQDLLDMMLRECRIIVHLHGKLPAGSDDFCFTPPQRSTLDLLRYLSFVGLGSTHALLDGTFDRYQALSKQAEDLSADGFPKAMEQQMEGLTSVFGQFTDADLAEREVKLPWDEVTSLGRALLMFPYGCLVAYRMQLFLYAKGAGNTEIGTANCWAGMDMPA